MVRHFFTSALGAALLASAASAQTGVYVDFVDDLAVATIPAPGFAAAAGTGGTWNGVDPFASVGGILNSGPLLDSSGSTSAIELTIDGQGSDPVGLFFDAPNTTGDDGNLLDDFIYFNGGASFVFSNLPAGNYEVYTYAMAPDNAIYETSVEVTGSPDPLQVVGGDFSAGYAQGTTHALHTVSVGATGTIEVITNVFTSFDSIAGIQIVPAGGVGPIGASYCNALPNSTGAAASISAVGSAVASSNDVTLSAAGMPGGQFGIFITSQTQAATPLQSGILCVGGNIIRFQGPGQILQASPSGEFSLQIDTTALPGLTPIPINPGETWNFTTWFRDFEPGVGNTANFTDGVSITFL